VLFGLSAPLSKRLLPSIDPLLLAGLLYVGAGSGLLAGGRLSRLRRPGSEARIRRSDLGYLIGIVVLGGIVGPASMMYGLSRTSATTGSLLLNLEAPLTILVAVAFFKEHLGTRGALAALLILAGAGVLGYTPGELRGDHYGVLLIAGACAAWAVDNNLTQRLSLRDPIAIVRIKALGAGTLTTAVALMRGAPLPSARVLGLALLLGASCYGVSIVLDVYALRLLGAAREAAFFATAPFAGALASVPLAGDRPGFTQLVAALLMAAGAWLLTRERHGHVHAHDPIEHDHAHVHDEHHRHEHEGSVAEPHAHPHNHPSLVHDHPHVPDLHHRHRH
jgi:drug/metabolite transporter (DMT)-like permease